jgi:hypothetical protein
MIACIHQCANQPCGVFAAHAIDIGDLSPAMNSTGVVVLGFGLLREPFERDRISALEACTLGIHPLLELRNVAEIEAIQEFSAVLPERCGKITTRERRLKITDVTGDDCRVQPNWIDAVENVVVYRAADCIEKLLEGMSRARLSGIRPEEKMQLIPAASFITSRCEHGKQRKPAVLVAVLAEESVVLRTSERERPERPKTKATRRR